MVPIRFRYLVPLFGLFIASALARGNEVYQLKKLLISDTEAKAAAMDPAKLGPNRVVVEDVPLFSDPEFEKTVAKYFGQPISTPLLNELINDITAFARAHDRLIAKVQIPSQNITSGALRLAVVIGRYNQLSFRGNRWFSSKLLEERLGIKPGDEIRISTLEDAVAWVNTNPFRRVKVLVNDLTNTPGKADLIVGVEEQRPFRLAASYDDSGNAVLGRNHYTASAQFGNLWGLDHIASYQFVTTDQTSFYQAHSVDYRIPLPWRHFLEFSGAYVEARPVLESGLFRQTGKTYLGNLRYTIPIREGDNPVEVYAGADFKRTNNNLEFQTLQGYLPQFTSTTDTIQGSIGGSLVQHDPRGAWLFTGSVVASPAGLDSRNHTAVFRTARIDASARYVYGTAGIQRLLNLDRGWSLYSRLNAQYSSTNLLPGEELSIGGVGTVRGYDPNIFSGDHGFVFSNDLQSPVIAKQLSFLGKKSQPLETRFVMFYDTARVYFHTHEPVFSFPAHQQVGWDDDPLRTIGSVGLGLRMNIGTNFNLTFDYGWHTTHLPGAAQNGRGDIKVVFAY